MIGIILPLCCKMSNKHLITVAIILLLQPMEWAKVINAIMNPDYITPKGINYWAITSKAQSEGTFWEMLKVNLWEGQLASLKWAWQHGRIFQTAGLFLSGLWLGRTKLFTYSKEHSLVWHKYLLFAVVLFFPLNGIHSMLPDYISNKEILKPLQLIIKSYANICVMIMLSVMVVMAYYYSSKKKLTLWLAPYGRMSLTNYISQSIIGALFFYNWGFNLNIGITYSFLFGIALFIVQLTLCTIWLKHFSHGPFEIMWKYFTWMGSKRKQAEKRN